MKEVCPCAPGHTASEWLGQNQSSELRSVQPQGQARHAAWQSAQRIRRTKPLPPSPSVVLRVLQWHIQTRPKVLKAICWWIKGSRMLTLGRSWQYLVPIFIKTAQNTLAFQAMLRYSNQWDWCHPRWGLSRGSFSSNSGAHWEPWRGSCRSPGVAHALGIQCTELWEVCMVLVRTSGSGVPALARSWNDGKDCVPWLMVTVSLHLRRKSGTLAYPPQEVDFLKLQGPSLPWSPEKAGSWWLVQWSRKRGAARLNWETFYVSIFQCVA